MVTSDLPNNPDHTPAQSPEQPSLRADEEGRRFVVEDIDQLTAQEAEAITRVALPTRGRRAPRMGRFFFVGALVGIALGLVLGLWLSDPNMTKRGIYLTVIVLFVTTIVELIVGGIVIFLEKRSARAVPNESDPK